MEDYLDSLMQKILKSRTEKIFVEGQWAPGVLFVAYV